MRFGEYEVCVTPRRNCKRMTLRCRPGSGELRLSVPPHTSERHIRDFLESSRPWIEAHAKPALSWQPAFAPGERHWVLGVPVCLGEAGVPAGQAAFEDYRAACLRREIERLVPMWAQRLGVTAHSVKFRAMTSRWGSCQTVRHDITFSLRLGSMPPACVEYVVVHELCHLIHPDHSPAFHAEMTRWLPDWRARRERLNHFDPSPLSPAR